MLGRGKQPVALYRVLEPFLQEERGGQWPAREPKTGSGTGRSVTWRGENGDWQDSLLTRAIGQICKHKDDNGIQDKNYNELCVAGFEF